MSKYIFPFTVGLLALCLVLAVLWLLADPSFEPALTSFGLLASLIGVYADRIISEKEKRKSLLVALAHELHMNVAVLKDKSFSEPAPNADPFVYPRLFTSTTSAVISSGVFSAENEKEFFTHMCKWLAAATIFNKKLDITEVRLYTVASVEEIAALRARLSKGKSFEQTKAFLKGLIDHLIVEYKIESGIEYASEIFNVDQ